MKLEQLSAGAQITGIDPSGPVALVAVEWLGEDVVSVVYRGADGRVSERMLSRTDEERLAPATTTRAWSFQSNGGDFRLATEALRIKLAHLFDPMMAVHTSNVEPLPHQISAVYEHMLPRQPLRYVLADDPGAGKTIMAGLFIRELVMRADARRILIVAPGSLVGQWQDELREKFGLEFEIFSRERQEASGSGNYFLDQDHLLVRLDQLSRNEEYREKLSLTDWDLIIVDEAHKLSASYFGGEVKKTRRFQLGEQLGGLCRHFLLMTATPHNGKEEDFQLFLSLLDGDRFYGKFREGAHKVEVGDLMRRMVKEKLVKFDGTPLFPERRAYTAQYELSDIEAALYESVTTYVREEMNRADRLDGKRKGTVGFALTILQRRLASSPEAIYQSLKRRRARLETELAERRTLARGRNVREDAELYVVRKLDVPDNLFEADDELSAEEYEAYADQVSSQATSAQTLAELEAEIISLQALEQQARDVVQSGNDSKWRQLSALLESPEMRDPQGRRRKLIIFTEQRDTLNYLRARIADTFGNPDAILAIHGGVNRDERRKVQERFRQDKQVVVLLATDAAGEGVNLQNAHLMINYDLPWNPNRIEQRFGRIHRIGQREVCHLWNLVASGTREGAVFQRLFEKLEVERLALGGQVFDILGEAFEGESLKDLLIEAIRYGERPDVRARLNQVIDGALDTAHLSSIIQRNALVDNSMTMEHLFAIKEEMDKAQARKLQPYFLRSFFLEAFAAIGGDARRREGHRYEIPHVPAVLRERDRQISDTRTPVLTRYARICFDKSEIHVDGKPMADLVHPAHPLMAALIDVVLIERQRSLREGTILLDPTDEGSEPSLLLLLDHAVREGSSENVRHLSRRIQFVHASASGQMRFAGWAPHLDLEPLEPADLALVEPLLDQPWLASGVESRAVQHAATMLAPDHYDEVRQRRERQVSRIHEAVHHRLVKEINYLSSRAAQLDIDVAAGRQPRVQPQQLRRRAEELAARLQTRTRELEDMRHIVSATPVLVGGALVVPMGLLRELRGQTPAPFSPDAAARRAIELRAMAAVIAHEEALGHAVKDVSAEKCGWDITAQPPATAGALPEPRHIEVKGRARGADVITVTRNEICTALNQGEKFWLAIVLIDGDHIDGPHYIPQPFTQEPEPGATSVNFQLAHLLAQARTE
ncbi:helicase-related protein [Denitratimonas sp. CY0512]|uniref:helicase-related protein n=1 Tax=Denitratimonas sp. CY0512 TaxID=3131940 RepID=UPI0030AB7EA9